MSHLFNKIICMVFALVAGQMYAAHPGSTKKQFVTNIDANLKLLSDLVARISKWPEGDLKKELERYDKDTLSMISGAITQCDTALKHVHTHRQQKSQSAAAPAATVAPAATAAQAHHKKADEQSDQSAQAADAKKFAGMGVDTIKFMQQNPKYLKANSISDKVKKLIGLTADAAKLNAFCSMKRNVTGVEAGLLGIFCNCSQAKLQAFVEYVKALITGRGITSYYDTFHESTVCGNAYEAVMEMELSQIENLDMLLSKIAQGIKE